MEQTLSTTRPFPATAAKKMSSRGQTSAAHAPINREVGYTEHSWCRAAVSGTGVTLVGLQLSNQPPDSLDMREILNVIRESHPLLSCKLHYAAATKTFTFRQSSVPSAISGISFHDGPATLELIARNRNSKLSPFHKILEHEMNDNSWSDPISFPADGIDVVFGSQYVVSESERVLVLRLHLVVCDRRTATSLIRELAHTVAEGVVGRENRRLNNDGEGAMSLEGLIQTLGGLKKKRMWARGMDMLSYSFSFVGLANLEFKVRGLPTATELARLRINTQTTTKILAGCESRGIKLCGVLAAAALLTAHSTRNPADKGKKKYGVATLTSCRPDLGTMISDHHFGFYQSVILSNHTIKGTETLWELASTYYADFAHDKNNNKHLTDTADLNFLMAKTIDNPSLTASSSHRTSLVSVFEDTVYESSEILQKIGTVDWVGCSSIHGIGASMGIFDTIRNGALDCAIVYPVPLHSRQQMGEVVGKMEEILIDGSKSEI